VQLSRPTVLISLVFIFFCVTTSVIDSLERFLSEMIYYVPSGMLNLDHSLASLIRIFANSSPVLVSVCQNACV